MRYQEMQREILKEMQKEMQRERKKERLMRYYEGKKIMKKEKLKKRTDWLNTVSKTSN